MCEEQSRKKSVHETPRGGAKLYSAKVSDHMDGPQSAAGTTFGPPLSPLCFAAPPLTWRCEFVEQTKCSAA